MKKYMLIVVPVFIIFLASCGSPSAGGGKGNGDSTGISDSNATAHPDSLRDSTLKPDSNALKGAVPDKIADSFVMKASAASMMEVMGGQLAANQAVNPRIKAFGSMMIKDHSAANEKLKAIAGAKNIAMVEQPTSDMIAKLDALKKQTGKSFDKTYLTMMMEGHKNALALFERAASGLHDPELKAFATTTIPTIKMHLDSLKLLH